MNCISKNIKFLRQHHNLTQEDLANIVGKARSLISAWESDDREITTEDIIKLSNYFNVSMDSLVGDDLSKENNVDNDDKYNNLFLKYKQLKEEDKELIKNLIEIQHKKIDKQLGEE